MSKQEKIKGVPVSECIKYVWSLVHSLDFKETSILSKEDLFQVGFIELIKRSKKRYKKKNKRMHLVSMRDCIYYTILKEIDRHKYPVKVPSYISHITNELKKKYKETEYYNKETENLRYYELYASNLESFKYKSDIRKHKQNREKVIKFLCRENASLQASSLARSVEFLNTFKYKNIQVQTETLMEEECMDSLLETIINLNILDKHKNIFILYFGLNGYKMRGVDIAKKYNIVLNSVYRIIGDIKKILIRDGIWIDDNFGSLVLKKLRRKLFILNKEK